MGLNCHATGDDNGIDSIKVRHKTTRALRVQFNVSLKFSHNFFVAEFFILFPTQRDCVSGNIFVGFSDTSAEHFFYGTLTPVSLQKLLEICNINHKLPGAMSTIGFPEGFQVLV